MLTGTATHKQAKKGYSDTSEEHNKTKLVFQNIQIEINVPLKHSISGEKNGTKQTYRVKEI